MITKLDVLTGIDTLKILLIIKQKTEKLLIISLLLLLRNYTITKQSTQIYQVGQKILPFRTFDELPENAKKYIGFIEEYLGINVYLVSVYQKEVKTLLEKNYSNHNFIKY